MKKNRSKIVNKKRFYTFIFICVVIISTMVALFFNIKISFGASNDIMMQEYIVRENDTVWEVAKKFNTKNDDIRNVVDSIIEENEIVNSTLIPGETIKIPNI